MWVNIDFGLTISEIVAYLTSLNYRGRIYLSINYLINFQGAAEVLANLEEELTKTDLDVSWGPHFIEEGLLQDCQVSVFDELYFSTPGEKIIWYINNFSLPEDFTTIVMLGNNLGIEPIIIKMKDKSSNYDYCFVQKEPISLDISKLLGDTNYSLSRIKE